MIRTFIVIFLTGIALFIPYFPIFAVGGPGEGSSSEAILPGLQPPSLRAGAVIGGESTSSAEPIVLPALSAASVESLFGRLLSPFTEALTGLGERLGGIENRLGVLESNVNILQNTQHQESLKKPEELKEVREEKTKPLVLPPALVAKVAAAVENRALSAQEEIESESFTSDELQYLQHYFENNYNSKHHDIYNICLLFLSLNIGSMPLDLHNKDTFNYKLLYCLIENILSSNSEATDFQRAKAEILHCALVLLNKYNIVSKTLEEKIWFYKGNAEIPGFQGVFLNVDTPALQKAYQDFYLKKLLVQVFKEPSDPLWANLALEACFYAVIHVHEHGENIMIDEEFIKKARQEGFGVYDEHTEDFEHIFKLLSAKIVRVFSILKTKTKKRDIFLSSPLFSMSMILKKRIVLAYGLLRSVAMNHISHRDDSIYNSKNPDKKKMLEKIINRARDNFSLFPYSFEILFEEDLMNLHDFPEIDRSVLMHIIIKNTFSAQGYFFESFDLQQDMKNLQWGEESNGNFLLFLSSLFYYFDLMSRNTKEEKKEFVEKMKLLQKNFEAELVKFQEWQTKIHLHRYSSRSRLLVVYRVFSYILFQNERSISFEVFAEKFRNNVQQGVQQLWTSAFDNTYEYCQQYEYYINYREARKLKIYTTVLIETLVTGALLYYKEEEKFPSLETLIPMDLETFRLLLKRYWVPVSDDNTNFLSYILYLIYPNDLSLEDMGFRSYMSSELMRNRLRELLTNSQDLEIHLYLQNLIKEFLNSAEWE